MIDKVNTSIHSSFKAEAQQLLKGLVKKQQVQTGSDNKHEDTVSLGNKPVDDATYTAAVSDQELGTTFTMLRDLLITNFKEQGIASTISTGESEIDLETLTPEEATELVSDDGYFGVQNTAQRIFDFAVGVAGNDPSRLDAIMDGVADGFAQAEEAWGGTLPDISYATRDAIGTMLEEWSGQEVEF